MYFPVSIESSSADSLLRRADLLLQIRYDSSPNLHCILSQTQILHIIPIPYRYVAILLLIGTCGNAVFMIINHVFPTNDITLVIVLTDRHRCLQNRIATSFFLYHFPKVIIRRMPVIAVLEFLANCCFRIHRTVINFHCQREANLIQISDAAQRNSRMLHHINPSSDRRNKQLIKRTRFLCVRPFLKSLALQIKHCVDHMYVFRIGLLL